MKIAVAVCGATSGRAEERAAAAQVENTGLMSGRVHTEVEIQASAERVWAILSDLSDYPSWNPFVRQISGILRKDERLKVTLQPPGGRAMSFRPAVIVAETNRELRWRGSVIVPGIFDGEHYFIIEPRSASSVRFVQGEDFSGVLVPFLGSVIRNASEGFVAMNAALKQRAESGSR